MVRKLKITEKEKYILLDVKYGEEI
jgi:hypothetical protein